MTRINHSQFTLAQSTHRLLQLMTHYVSIRQRSVDAVYAKLSTAMLTQQHQRHLSAYQQIQMRLHTTILTNLSTQSRNLDSLCARLHALNPQHVLKRGYAVVKCAQGVIHSHRQLKPQDRIDLVFHDGHSTAIIQE
jgi:exonuclease VII large subunit